MSRHRNRLLRASYRDDPISTIPKEPPQTLMVSVTDSAGKICCAVCFDPMSQHEKQGDAYVSCDGVRMLFRD